MERVGDGLLHQVLGSDCGLRRPLWNVQIGIPNRQPEFVCLHLHVRTGLCSSQEGATPFIHGLVGGASRGQSNASLVNYSAFAWAAGGGVDLNISPRIAIRIAQFDYEGYRVPRGNASSLASGVRYSMGVVFKF